mgnify:CR=1 FL=1
MATVVYVHAHPDDEASQTSGAMARLARTGHRVVVAYGTNGDHGEVPDDLGDETLTAYRRREAEASAQVTGVQRVAWLGYSDSGMTGWAQNDDGSSFHKAPLDEAARRLADILDEEDADVVVGYDWHGSYGHPDHVKVHHVTRRAAELARRRPRLLESTMSRDHLRGLFQLAKAAGMDGPDGPEGRDGMDAGWDPDQPMDDGNPFGMPESELHYRVDVRDLIEVKRAALACHMSQKSDIGSFLSMPIELFAAGFGYEFYLEPGRPPGMVDAFPFDEID